MDFILFDGKIETLAYFSYELCEELKNMGHSATVYNFYADPAPIKKKCVDGSPVLLTFNYVGLFNEEEYEFLLDAPIRKVCIIVDHPMYYNKPLSDPRNNDIILICIDRLHLEYIKKYYPEVKNVFFMPLAGACPKELPAKKEYDVIFTGNLTRYTYFDPYIERHGKEYSDFYHGIIDEMLANPLEPIDKVCIKHIINDIPEATDREIRDVMGKMLFIDLYVRFYRREQAILELVKGGANVKIVGKGFGEIGLPETPLMPTEYCLLETAKAKISLNILPGFCDGSHDRVLSAMLCGCVSLTDKSKWLMENFEDNKEIAFYDIERIPSLTEKINWLLNDQAVLSNISEAGHKKALELHTWNSRALKILELIRDYCIE